MKAFGVAPKLTEVLHGRGPGREAVEVGPGPEQAEDAPERVTDAHHLGKFLFLYTLP